MAQSTSMQQEARVRTLTYRVTLFRTMDVCHLCRCVLPARTASPRQSHEGKTGFFPFVVVLAARSQRAVIGRMSANGRTTGNSKITELLDVCRQRRAQN